MSKPYFHPELVDVFKDTLDIIAKGRIKNLQGEAVLHDCDELISDDVPYEKFPESVLRFEEVDSLVAAKELVESGWTTAVLNMASDYKPGGGVFVGATAQEESLCRRTNLITSLYTFTFTDLVDAYKKNHNLKGDNYSAPLGDAVIYTEDVAVFKSPESDGCKWIDPFHVDVVSAAAVKHPELDSAGNFVNPLDKKSTENRIKAMLRAAMDHNAEAIVLGAFGCGAYRNNPKVIADIFEDVLINQGYLGYFSQVVFAVIGKDENKKIFSEMCSRSKK